METAAFLLSLRNSLGESRAQRLYGDLRFALERTDRAALKAWGFRSAGRMGLLAARRVNGVFNLLHSLFRFGGREAGDLLKALRQGDLPRHLAGRSAAAIDNTLEVGREARQMLSRSSAPCCATPRTRRRACWLPAWVSARVPAGCPWPRGLPRWGPGSC